MRKNKIIIIVSILFTIVIPYLPYFTFAADEGLMSTEELEREVRFNFEEKKKIAELDQRIEPRLRRLILAHKEKSVAGFQKLAKKQGIEFDYDRLLITLKAKNGGLINKGAVLKNGGRITYAYKDYLMAKVPISAIGKICSAEPNIERIGLPVEAALYAESEGVGLVNASTYHNKGVSGDGVKVAVIDSGFYRLTDAINHGELPANVIRKNITGNDFEDINDSEHGTANAEILYDFAPDAQLYLIKVKYPAHIQEAKDYCVANGINIVSSSIGFSTATPGNGSGEVNDWVNDAGENGVLWVNAAGNYAKKHWEGVFSDNDGDNIHDFLPDNHPNDLYTNESNYINVNAGEKIRIILRWDDWPYSDNDYGLYLLTPNKVTVYADEEQAGTQPPFESIIDYPAPSTGKYYIYVKKHPEAAKLKFEIFDISKKAHSLQRQVASGSLSDEPTDASGAMVVGAIDKKYWTTGPIESFSSQGPTNAWAGVVEATKPDIVGPDNITNYIYGTYPGTSASAPSVAGAAALLLSANPSYSVDKLQSELEKNAVDTGVTGKDNIYGAGKLKLPALNNAPELSLIGNRNVNEGQKLEFAITATDPDGDTLIYSATGLPVGAAFNTATRTFSWTPGYSQSGTYSNVAFKVSDGSLSDEEGIAITVKNVNQTPRVVSLTPSFASSRVNKPASFTATFSDLDGWQDIRSANFIAHKTSAKKTGGISVYYNQNEDKFYFWDEKNSKWLSAARGSNATLKGKYGQLNVRYCSISGSANNLTATFNITPFTNFRGTKGVYLYTDDDSGASSGWKNMGTWRVK